MHACKILHKYYLMSFIDFLALITCTHYICIKLEKVKYVQQLTLQKIVCHFYNLRNGYKQ